MHRSLRAAATVALSLATFALAAPAAADEPAAPFPSAPPTPDPKADGKTVTVELSSNSTRATIERRVGTTSLAALPFTDTSFGSVSHWEHSCVAPCELKLDPHYAYRVAGDGLTPSESFALPRNKDRVTLSAEMGSSTARLSGMALTALGVSSSLLGGTALVLTPVFESQDVGSKGFRSAVLVGGIVFLAAGVLETAMGLYLWMSNGTTVRADHGVLTASGGTGGGTGGEAKAPSWHLTPAGLVF